LSGLAPGSAYLCEGTEEATILADEFGIAGITVDIDARAQIRIRAKI
jgi:hypothetical protein